MKRTDVCSKNRKKKLLEMSIPRISLNRTFLGYPHFPLFSLSDLVTPSISSIFSVFHSSVKFFLMRTIMKEKMEKIAYTTTYMTSH